MTEYEAIFARKSVRNYSTKEIPEALRQEITDWFYAIPVFDEAAHVTLEWATPQAIFQGMRGMNVQAPYYLVLRAEKSQYGRESAGYLGELLALHLVTLGIGTCWVGGARPKKGMKPGYVIALAAGYPREDIRFRTEEAEFQRKPHESYCASVVEGSLFADALDAARLAPSGMNLQPLKYEAPAGAMHILRKPAAVPFLLEPMQRVDAGIGLSHVVLALEHAGKRARICPQPAPSAARFHYVISVKAEEGAAPENPQQEEGNGGA